ncbi:MAG: hypothetical protein U5Q16_10610 [Gammaproteobacteria bacterium]|nr:hypothetical protein [Gammaproteobacteria bacterium]
MLLLLGFPAQAELAVELADTDPQASQSLFTGDALSVRLIYESDELNTAQQAMVSTAFREAGATDSVMGSMLVPLTGYTIFALLAGSNLWPLMLLFLTPLAFLYLAGVGLARLVVLRRV